MGQDIEKLIKDKGGILLDIGAGENVQKGFVGMDKRSLPGIDIVHDLEVFPYPIPDGCCISIIGSHIVEHIKPWLMIDFMNELWRVIKTDGQLALVHPYGVNHLFVQDPTHCNPCSEATWQYFDPQYPLYQIYKPSPWEIQKGFPVWNSSGIMEVVFRKKDKEMDDLSVDVKEKVGLKESVGPGHGGGKKGKDKNPEKETKDNQQ